MKTYLEKVKERRKVVCHMLRTDLKNEAQWLVQLLNAEGFEFKRVYLFGSVTNGKSLSAWSDIDLAIEGLEDAMFYKAYACLLKNSNFSVDLKPFEGLEGSSKEKIIREGWIIYEKE
ncbi:nucleotidyltransferase domain-containing protein [bacterium]|nr:nucleotidyltransferase domain-containing protein [bacterium]RQV99128.1 MAG: nucleotidyltransferase domain-containing protein [bacterium]